MGVNARQQRHRQHHDHGDWPPTIMMTMMAVMIGRVDVDMAEVVLVDDRDVDFEATALGLAVSKLCCGPWLTKRDILGACW